MFLRYIYIYIYPFTREFYLYSYFYLITDFFKRTRPIEFENDLDLHFPPSKINIINNFDQLNIPAWADNVEPINIIPKLNLNNIYFNNSFNSSPESLYELTNNLTSLHSKFTIETFRKNFQKLKKKQAGMILSA